jgi:hypothetical protein
MSAAIENPPGLEDISLDIYTALKNIQTGFGYETDVGSIVFRGKASPVDKTQMPCCVIFEGADEIKGAQGELSPKVLTEQYYMLVAYLPCDPDNPNDAGHAAIRDLKKAIFNDASFAIKKKYRNVKYLGRYIGPRADGESIVHASIEISVEYLDVLKGKII